MVTSAGLALKAPFPEITVGDRELGQYGITVSTIPPRAVVTPMFMAAPFAQGPAGQEAIRQLAARTPVRRPGVPEDIAAASLCSDDAGYITGQMIGVNGGTTPKSASVPLSGTSERPVSPNP